MLVSEGRTACWQYGQNILAVGEDGGQSVIALTWDNSFSHVARLLTLVARLLTLVARLLTPQTSA